MRKVNQAPRRGRISAKLERKLQNELKPLISYVASHEDLDLQVRDNYFNIYFNGGNALRVTAKGYSFDPWYFYYGTYNGVEIPKTYIAERLSGKETARKIIPANYPSKETAEKIFTEISKRAEELMKMAANGRFESYFEIAVGVVKEWVEKYERFERKKQHIIACSNRRFTGHNDLVVIDIEFAVSTKKTYNKATSINGKPKVPKMDVIAVDKNGQLYSIELKDNLQADRDGSAQDVKHHLSDFANSIGSTNPTNDFPVEMSEVVKSKQNIGLLDSAIFVNTSRIPIFAVAYTGSNSEELNEFRRKHSELTIVNIEKRKDGNKQYLYLQK